MHGHGGVCILVKDKFIHSQVQFQADLQAVAVCIITINNKTYTVASVYVPPSGTLNELAFDRMINSFSSRYLILGDFNGHSHLWGANQENERGKNVEKLIDRHNLILLNDSVHTRFDTYHQTSSLLDLSLCHPSIYMDVACEISSDRLGSDHHPIIITANTSDHPVPERVPKWNFKKAKWDAFQDQCITEITPNLFNDAEDKMAIFSSTLLDIAADNIPKTSPFPKRKAKPWFDEDCQAAKKERNKANRLANKHPSAANSMRARLIQARTKKLFKQKKRDSWKNYVSLVNVNTPSKKVWDMIRKITGKNVASPMHHLKDDNGTLITDRVEITNTLGAAIEKSLSSNNYSKEFQSIKAQKEKQKINFKTNRNLRYNKKFTMRDLKRSLKKSNNSFPGPDQIHYEILRHLPIETLHILLDIINETWKSDTFPESWREALIISIPKPGKDHFNPLNYRPIALTSCICKTVERMVNERLVWYLEKNGLLAKQQCGYRSNRSTVDHLVRLETFIRDAFIHNQHLVAVFFDLQKAYDTTWKYGILKDLHNMGLRGNLPIFIGNFLSNRTFQIHLGTILSDKIFHQEEGVPQGAILSTTLFNVKINDIVKQVDPGVECSLYVDDFVIMYRSPTIDAIQRKLQHTIHRLEKWTLENGFTISKNKTVAMHFCPDKKCMDPVLKLDNDLSNSMSCLQAIEGEDTENPFICHIMNLLWSLSDKGTRVRFCWVPSHCGIDGNEIVDQLAKETLNQDIDPLASVHYTDMKPLVNSYIQNLVQTKWDVAVHGRDLYLVKPTLGPPKKFQHLTRAEEVVITRLRIGHTKATKSHILSRGPPTSCHHCGQTLTIDHMLLECALLE